MKRILAAFLLIIATSGAKAQTFLESVYLSVDKGMEAVYAKGDTIRVFAETDRERPAVLKLFLNGKPQSENEVLLKAGRTEVFRVASDEAVALMFQLADKENRKDSTRVGAIVAPEDFRPGFEEPADFREFWEEQLRPLREQKMMRAKLTPVKVPGEDADKYRCYDLEIMVPLPGVRPARGYLALPKKAKKHSLPIAIYAHSAGPLTASYTKSSIQRAVSLAKRGGGAIALDINAHGILNGQDDAYYEAMEIELNGYAYWPVTGHEKFYFRGMFLRLVSALDYLCCLKEWDGKRVLVTGGSQGGAQCAALAGLDPRVTMVVVDVPALWDTGAILKGRASRLERWGVDTYAKEILPYYDACNFLRYYKGDLVVNVGLIDDICPPANVWATFNVCPAKSKVIHPCAWKAHSGRYSIPDREARSRLRHQMDRYQSADIDSFLR
ncbi:MAG: acetylxylan esterase [Bacteroidales bacterium]|nr:acetylxylan esterase [Bacteroidales bacterium]